MATATAADTETAKVVYKIHWGESPEVMDYDRLSQAAYSTAQFERYGGDAAETARSSLVGAPVKEGGAAFQDVEKPPDFSASEVRMLYQVADLDNLKATEQELAMIERGKKTGLYWKAKRKMKRFRRGGKGKRKKYAWVIEDSLGDEENKTTWVGEIAADSSGLSTKAVATVTSP